MSEGHIAVVGCFHPDPSLEERIPMACQALQPDAIAVEAFAPDIRWFRRRLRKLNEGRIADKEFHALDTEEQRAVYIHLNRQCSQSVLLPYELAKRHNILRFCIDSPTVCILRKKSCMRKHIRQLLACYAKQQTNEVQDEIDCLYREVLDVWKTNNVALETRFLDGTEPSSVLLHARDEVLAACLRDIASHISGTVAYFSGLGHAMDDTKKRTAYSLLRASGSDVSRSSLLDYAD